MKRLFRWLLVAAILAVAIAGIVFLPDLRYRKLANEYPQALAAAKAAGIPTNAEEFAPAPIPDEENAAIELKVAMELYDSDRSAISDRVNEIKKAVEDPSATVPAPTPDMVQIMNICRTAAKKPKCQFTKDWSDPINTTFPEYAPLKNFARMLDADMIIKARAGQWDIVHENALAVQKLADFSASDQVLIGGLVSVAIKSINYSSLVQIVDESNAHPRILEIIEDVCAKNQNIKPSHIFRGEAYMSMYAAEFAADKQRHKEFEEMMTGWGGMSDTSTYSSGTLIDKLKDLFSRSTDEETPRPRSFTARRAQATTLVQLTTEMYQPILQGDLRWEEAAKSLDYENRINNMQPSVENELAVYIFPMFDQAFLSFRVSELRAQLLETAVEIHRYHAAKGRFPKTGDIVLPTDPFSGKDLLLKSSATGFQLYSVGANGKDDGGIYKNPVSNRDIDLVYQFRMPDTVFSGR
ncbi:MAG: hypothetical protein KDC26_10515 [Armatimonadetes bacterium]|nr:hypothetical protein [Armatimonadota bacterium]